MSNSVSEAIVLVGGKGTRLQSVVSDRPKPMAEVCGRPFLEWLLRYLKNQNIERVVLATGYKGEMVEAYFGNGDICGLDISYSQELKPAGTGGAIRLALSRVQSDHVIALNGDSLCPLDINRMYQLHLAQEADATLWLVEMEDCRRYGTVDLDISGKVRAFQEKSSEVQKGLINGGVYLFNKDLMKELIPNRPVSLEMEVFPKLVHRNLFGVIGNGPFIDIGTPESYALADSFITQANW